MSNQITAHCPFCTEILIKRVEGSGGVRFEKQCSKCKRVFQVEIDAQTVKLTSVTVLSRLQKP